MARILTAWRDVRYHGTLLSRVDEWRKRQSGTMTRAMAIDTLVNTALYLTASKAPHLGEVIAVLDMWDLVERSYAELSKTGKAEILKRIYPYWHGVRFPGFGETDEVAHLSIARFLVEELGWFGHFKGYEMALGKGNLEPYRRMLRVYLPIRAKLTRDFLSPDELVATLVAVWPRDGD